jgi:hypothetical protein
MVGIPRAVVAVLLLLVQQAQAVLVVTAALAPPHPFQAHQLHTLVVAVVVFMLQ